MASLRGAPIGFIGLGTMGESMALNLAKAGSSLVVWNRTPSNPPFWRRLARWSRRTPPKCSRVAKS